MRFQAGSGAGTALSVPMSCLTQIHLIFCGPPACGASICLWSGRPSDSFDCHRAACKVWSVGRGFGNNIFCHLKSITLISCLRFGMAPITRRGINRLWLPVYVEKHMTTNQQRMIPLISRSFLWFGTFDLDLEFQIDSINLELCNDTCLMGFRLFILFRIHLHCLQNAGNWDSF